MGPDPDPIGKAVRRQRQIRRVPLGAACALCGEADPALLKQHERSILEGHHAAGRFNDAELLITLCLNCHTKATNKQLDVGALPPGQKRSALEMMQLGLLSLATFFELLAKTLYKWAAQLGKAIAALTLKDPDWRLWPDMP